MNPFEINISLKFITPPNRTCYWDMDLTKKTTETSSYFVIIKSKHVQLEFQTPISTSQWQIPITIRIMSGQTSFFVTLCIQWERFNCTQDISSGPVTGIPPLTKHEISQNRWLGLRWIKKKRYQWVSNSMLFSTVIHLCCYPEIITFNLHTLVCIYSFYKMIYTILH